MIAVLRAFFRLLWAFSEVVGRLYLFQPQRSPMPASRALCGVLFLFVNALVLLKSWPEDVASVGVALALTLTGSAGVVVLMGYAGKASVAFRRAALPVWNLVFLSLASSYVVSFALLAVGIPTLVGGVWGGLALGVALKRQEPV